MPVSPSRRNSKRVAPEQVKDNEVATHAMNHPTMAHLLITEVVIEILKDRKSPEVTGGQIVTIQKNEKADAFSFIYIKVSTSAVWNNS